jgi:hypothetical protein
MPIAADPITTAGSGGDSGVGCEERAGAPSPAASREQRGAFIICPINREKQRGDVKRAGASARTSEHDRASSCQLIFYVMVL